MSWSASADPSRVHEGLGKPAVTRLKLQAGVETCINLLKLWAVGKKYGDMVMTSCFAAPIFLCKDYRASYYLGFVDSVDD